MPSKEPHQTATGPLSTEVDLDSCKSPFGASPPELEVTVEDVKAIAEERGSEEILRSASDEWGDTITGRVRPFLATTLYCPAPMSKDQVKDLFVEDVVSPFPAREAALATFQELRSRPPAWITKYLANGDDGEPKVDEDEKNLRTRFLKHDKPLRHCWKTSKKSGSPLSICEKDWGTHSTILSMCNSADIGSRDEPMSSAGQRNSSLMMAEEPMARATRTFSRRLGKSTSGLR
jgi:hypothetical protein